MIDEKSWDRLLLAIEAGNIVTVLGSPFSLTAASSDPQSMQRLLARQLLDDHGVSAEGRIDVPGEEMNDAIRRIRLAKGFGDQNLNRAVEEAIQAVIRRDGEAIPASLRKISEITDLRLLVTLGADDLLARALRQRCQLREIVHAPNLPLSDRTDLPDDWSKRPNEVHLLYLFGRARSSFFAVHDEDVLEYAHNLLVGGRGVPTRFIDELRSRNRLLIGCGFPDWLVRFLVRLMNSERLAKKETREWVVDRLPKQSALTGFLDTFSPTTEVLSDLSPEEFVDQLHARWIARRDSAVVVAGSEMPPPDRAGVLFFISYSRTSDAPAAQRLHDELVKLGVKESEIWFDSKTLEPGDEFPERISDGIARCRHFIPLISKEADRMDQKFFRREWKRAIYVNESIMGRAFVVPLIVDTDFEPLGYERVPKEWVEKIDFGFAPAGTPNEQTCERLKNLIRAARLLPTDL